MRQARPRTVAPRRFLIMRSGLSAADFLSLLKNFVGAASEPFRDHKRLHFTAESCSILTIGYANHTRSGCRPAFFNRLFSSATCWLACFAATVVSSLRNLRIGR